MRGGVLDGGDGSPNLLRERQRRFDLLDGRDSSDCCGESVLNSFGEDGGGSVGLVRGGVGCGCDGVGKLDDGLS